MQPPRHDQLAADLRTLRERGPTRLRDSRLRALEAAAALCGHGGAAAADPYRPAAVERLLRRAIGELGGGNLAAAAEYTFGLSEGTRDWSIGDRRKEAAAVYRVSTERFRKHHEQVIVDETAEAILRLCLASTIPATVDLPNSPSVMPLGQVTLDFMPVEMIRGVDVIVSSENIYLEASKIFRNSMSAALRRACAEFTETGELVEDVVQTELTGWLRARGRLGLPVAPGTVAATDAGRLRAAGVRRIYHAAVAVPRTGADEYEFTPEAVARAVHNVFRLAELEDPPPASIALPLFGAGRGGLDPAESLRRLWAAVERELDEHPGRRRDLHLLTHNPEHAAAIVRHFAKDAP